MIVRRTGKGQLPSQMRRAGSYPFALFAKGWDSTLHRLDFLLTAMI